MFGSQRRLALAQADAAGSLRPEIEQRQPAEVQCITVGPWRFVGWPGEVFVEYALDVKSRWENTFVIAYANGETQGYLVTSEAVAEGGYEASTAIFKSPESPRCLVELTDQLLTTDSA